MISTYYWELSRIHFRSRVNSSCRGTTSELGSEDMMTMTIQQSSLRHFVCSLQFRVARRIRRQEEDVYKCTSNYGCWVHVVWLRWIHPKISKIISTYSTDHTWPVILNKTIQSMSYTAVQAGLRSLEIQHIYIIYTKIHNMYCRAIGWCRAA